MQIEKKIRIGVRGFTGLLGSRLCYLISKIRDFEITAGMCIPDKMLEQYLSIVQIQEKIKNSIPKNVYLQSFLKHTKEKELVYELNERQKIINFHGASQLSWKKNCDVIIDTAYPNGKELVDLQYNNFPGKIILQDGASPIGELLVPPVFNSDKYKNKKFIRIGDCIANGIVPLIYPFEGNIENIRVNMMTQYTGKEPYYLIHERANAFYLRDDVQEIVEEELKYLFPKIEIEVDEVVQIPSLLHYKTTMIFEMKFEISHGDIVNLLKNSPRIKVLPMGVNSVYDINIARSFDDGFAPITVFESSIFPRKGGRSKKVKITSAIYYRTAAVLPNIDAIRILYQGMNPIEAMKKTDQDLKNPDSDLSFLDTVAMYR